MPHGKNSMADEYEELHRRYFIKIIRDLKLTEKRIGLIVLMVRDGEEGCVDLASNLGDKDIMGALEDILKTMKKRDE